MFMDNISFWGDNFATRVVDHVTGNIVDVISGEIYPGCVNMYNGKIVHIERRVSVPQRYILPGLIDADIHVESSFLSPYRFAEQAVAHGTTAVIANVEWIADVYGEKGIEWLTESSRSSPMRFLMKAPCMMDGHEGEGTSWELIRKLFKDPRFVSLGEIMGPQGIITEDPDILAKMEVAAQNSKPIDGTAPGLSGYDLDRYMMAGISTDRGSMSSEEADEKASKGLSILVNGGPSSRELEFLHDYMSRSKYIMVTNETDIDGINNGHLDVMLRNAVNAGIDPINAIRAVTLWPARQYSIPYGTIGLGDTADLTVVKDLKDFEVVQTWIEGRLVSNNGNSLFIGASFVPPMEEPIREFPPETFRLRSSSNPGEARLFTIFEKDILGPAIVKMPVEDGSILPNAKDGIVTMAMIDLIATTPPKLYLVKGLGLDEGAIASTATNRSGMMMVVGTDDESMAKVTNAVISGGGGIGIVNI